MHDLYNGLTMSKTKKIKKYVIGAKHSTVTFKEKRKMKEKLHHWLVYANY